MERARQLFQHKYAAAILLMAAALLICIQNLAFYLNFSFNLYIALMVFPFVMRITKDDFSHRYAWLSLLAFILYPFIKIQLLFFLGFAFFIMFIIESFIGRLNSLPVFLLTVISPLSIYFFEIFGFPARLHITEWAVTALSSVYPDVTSEGNMILLAGQHFSVDRACAGLKMAITSYLICIAWMAYQEKRTQTNIPIYWSAGLLCLTLVLILVCNLFRIIALVIFKSQPETFSHELIGVISLGFCVILPLALLTRTVFRFFGRKTNPAAPVGNVNTKTRWFFIAAAFPIMVYLNFTRETYQQQRDENSVESASIPGYNCEILETGVLKFTDDSSLIYIKPSLAFYQADHTPLICWAGSGYEFKKENIVQSEGYSVYFAELESPKGKLYTAWWYDNGNYQTTDQLDWRWRMIKGEKPFRIVNVTCSTYEELIETSKKIMSRNLFM